MALRHGKKAYFQLLLDRNRAELLQELAGEQGVRATALARDAIYAHLETVLPSSTYNEAKANDEALWRESVRKRVDGREKARLERKANKSEQED
jgi:hypothetical protein